MPGDRKDFGAMLRIGNKQQPLVKGTPVQLSTEQPSISTEESAHVHISTSAKEQKDPQRTSQGYRLRNDLMKTMKRIAVDDERKLYEVMEEAFEQYIARRQQSEK